MSRGTHPRAPLLFVLLALTLSTSSAQADPQRKEGEVIIKFKETARPGEVASIRAALHATKLKHFTRIKAEHERISGLTVDEAIARFRGNPAVEYIEPNYIVHTTATPNDPLFDQLWGLHNTGQTGGVRGADIGALQAWDATTGSDILVAMIDTGVDYTHPDLAENIFINPGEIPGNGVDDDHNGFIDDVHGWDFVNHDNDPMDDAGHGTHTAGTVGAVGNNGVGVVGVSWHVRLLPLKFLSSSGFGSDADAVSCIEYATMMHARIMSNSWGGGGYSQAMYDAIQDAMNQGILFVAAAGNAAFDTDQTPFYPSAYDLPNVISVAATTASDDRAFFSNYGATTVDLGAPGVGILSTTPENTYSSFSGTSMACPHVAGALSLILSRFPTLSVDHAKRLLLDSTDPLPSLRGFVLSGGRLNIARALQGPDSTAPAAIADLTVLSLTSSKVRLGWTATGNDGTLGTALSYDLRYSTLAIDAGNFESATPFPGMPSPTPSGTHQEVTVTGLQASTIYFFAVRALDGYGNKSPVSNLASATTLLPPRIQVSPPSLSASLGPSAVEMRTISIRNPSSGILDYEITTIPTGTSPGSSARIVRATDTASAGATRARGGAAVAPLAWRDYARERSELMKGPAADTQAAPGAPVSAPALASASTAPLPVVITDPSGDGGFVDLTELRASSDQTNLNVELDFRASIDRLNFGGFLSLDVDQNRLTGVPASFASAGQDVGAEFEVHMFTLGSNTVSLYEARTRTLVRSLPVTLGPQSIRFSIPLANLEDEDGSVDVSGVVGDGSGPTDWFPDSGHATIPGIRWVAVTPNAGTVPPGGSVDLAVALNSRGLREGAYDGAIRIASNDPTDPEVSVPAHVDISGTPVMDVPSLDFDFGSVVAGASRTDSLVISNLGTSVLHVFGVTSDNPAFAVSGDPFNLAPAERRAVPITFTPGGIGPFTGTLQVSSDFPGGEELFGVLSGSGVAPPNVSASPLTLAANLRTGQISTQPLSISNTGTGDLMVELSVRSPRANVSSEAASAPNPNPVDSHGASSKELSDGTVVAAVDGPSAQFPILVIQNTNAWGLDLGPLLQSRFGVPVKVIHSDQVDAADFFRHDLIITVGDENTDYYDAISVHAPKFEAYVTAGGIVQYQVATHGNDVRLAGGVRFEFGNLEFQNRPVLRNHPVVAGLPWVLDGFYANHGFLSNLPPSTRVITETSLTHLPTTVEYSLGAGMVIATAMPWEFMFQEGLPAGPILTKASAYSLSQVRPRWLGTAPASAVLRPGESLNAQVTFDASWASGGGHDAFVRIGSNDPDQPELVLPAHLDVTPLPEIDLTRTALSFGALFVNGSRTDSVMVSNQGTAPLDVTDLSSTSPDFISGTAPFSLAPGESVGVRVTFHPGRVGPLEGTLHVSSNDSDEPVRTVVLSGTGLPAPVVSAASSSIEFKVPVGGHDHWTLAIGNHGGSDLTFVSEFQAPPTAAKATVLPPYASYPKGAPDPRVGIAVTTGIGGPDRFGYTWLDSDEPGGPRFEWVEISASGRRIPLIGDDLVSAPIAVGFDFPFYGTTFASFRICTNGFLSFTSRGTDFINQPLPSVHAPENLIAAFWDDLFVTARGGVFVLADSTRAVIEFQDCIQRFGSLDRTYTFEIILFPSGEFVFQYLSMLDFTNSATVGFQNGTGDDGTLVAFNTPYLHDRLAVRATARPRWIALQPGSGAIPPAGSQNVLAMADATGLAIGSYASVLLIHSNDPVTPVVPIPISLRVLPSVDATATKFVPSTFNRQSSGSLVRVFVELPAAADPNRVVLPSVRFQDSVPCAQRTLVIGDFNGNGIPDLQFLFDRGAVEAVLPEGDSVEVRVTGEVEDTAFFTARGTVRVIRPHLKAPNGGESLVYGSRTRITWDTPAEWDVDHADLAYSIDEGASWIPIAHGITGHDFEWFLPPVAAAAARVSVSVFDSLGLLGSDSSDHAFAITQPVTGVEEPAAPLVAALYQNSPNPFNPDTSIRFDLARPSQALLTIHGADGRMIRKLIDRPMPAGRQRAVWDGRDDQGRTVATGVYFYRLTAGTFRASRRLVLLK